MWSIRCVIGVRGEEREEWAEKICEKKPGLNFFRFYENINLWIQEIKQSPEWEKYKENCTYVGHHKTTKRKTLKAETKTLHTGEQ